MSSNYQQKKMMNALGAIDRQNSTCSPSSWAIQDFGSALSTEIFETT